MDDEDADKKETDDDDSDLDDLDDDDDEFDKNILENFNSCIDDNEEVDEFVIFKNTLQSKNIKIISLFLLILKNFYS
jgi:hypothetical protein